MLKILLAADDNDRRGNIILGNVAKAIAKANLPDAERKLNSELTSNEIELAKDFFDSPPDERKRLIFERTEHCLIDVDAGAILGTPNTRRHANLFTAEKDAWAEIRAGVVSKKLHPIDPDTNASLGGDNYGHGSVKFDQLKVWGVAAGYEFRIATSNDSQRLTGEPPIVGACSTATIKEAKPQPETDKPWLIADTTDPEPEQDWYIPARYFARQLVKDDSSLLKKRLTLAEKVVQSLTSVKIKKRGGTKSFDPATVLKAFSKVNLG